MRVTAPAASANGSVKVTIRRTIHLLRSRRDATSLLFYLGPPQSPVARRHV
jgi:hypothetical protein